MSKLFADIAAVVVDKGKHEVPLQNASQGRTIRNAFYAWRQAQVKAGHTGLNKIKITHGAKSLIFSRPEFVGYQKQLKDSLEK